MPLLVFHLKLRAPRLAESHSVPFKAFLSAGIRPAGELDKNGCACLRRDIHYAGRCGTNDRREIAIRSAYT